VTTPQELWRIGELSRRTGTGVPLLRAWETRYGVLNPRRTPGGFRLYSADDEARVIRMKAHISQGLAAAEAARLVQLEMEAGSDAASVGGDLVALRTAFHGYDEVAAEAALDRLAATFGIEMFLSHVILPYLRELGDRWERGDVSIAEEHFTTGILRARMVDLTTSLRPGTGPLVVLACPEDELHDLPLIAFALALRARGGRVVVLGANMPVTGIAAAADRLEPDLVVVSATLREPASRSVRRLATLARRHPVMVAGAGFDEAMAARAGADYLSDDPVSAALRILPEP
jgi:MerR family transcriptional regulator, light-induced transcriptional regulator